jgi:hypothetical protein
MGILHYFAKVLWCVPIDGASAMGGGHFVRLVVRDIETKGVTTPHGKNLVNRAVQSTPDEVTSTGRLEAIGILPQRVVRAKPLEQVRADMCNVGGVDRRTDRHRCFESHLRHLELRVNVSKRDVVEL